MASTYQKEQQKNPGQAPNLPYSKPHPKIAHHQSH